MPFRRLLAAAIALAALAAPARAERTISAEVYLDRLRGMWLGQVLGNYAGRPTEGAYTGRGGTTTPIDWASFISTDPWSGDDDTVLEYMNIPLVRDHGVPTGAQLRAAWETHVPLGYFYIANHQARRLMSHGFTPADTGSQRNNLAWWAIDSQITTEALGAAAPGMRQRAADLAGSFGGVTNEGHPLHAAQFYAAMYAAAPLETNVEQVVAKGLAVVPATSRSYDAVSSVLAWYDADKADGALDWHATHEKIYDRYVGPLAYGRYYSWVESTVNLALTAMALLYGQGDFKQTVEIAVQGGFDSDCNPATAGGLVGLMKGYSGLPADLTAAASDRYYVGSLQNITKNTTISQAAADWRAAAEQEIVRMGGWIENPGPAAVYHLPGDTVAPPPELPDPAGPAGLVRDVRAAGGTVTVSASVEKHNAWDDRTNLDAIIDGITDVRYNGRRPYSTYDGTNAQPAGGDWFQLNFDRDVLLASLVFHEGNVSGNENTDPRIAGLHGGYFTDLAVEVGRDGVFAPATGLALSEPLDPYTYFQHIELSFDAAVGDAVRIRGRAGGRDQFTTVTELEARGAIPAPSAWAPAGGHAWENPANWSPAGVPGPEGIAVFASAPQPVALAQPETALGLDLRSGGWTVEGAGHTLTLGAAGIAAAGAGTSVVAARVRLAANSICTIGEGAVVQLDGGLDGGGCILTKSGPGTLAAADATDLAGLNILGGTMVFGGAADAIAGPVALLGDSTLTTGGTLSIGGPLTVQGAANQVPAGTIVLGAGAVIDASAVLILNGALAGSGTLVVRGTLMGKGTIGLPLSIEAGGEICPGAPSTILAMSQILNAEAARTYSFEIGGPTPDYASPADSVNDLVRLTSEALPFADAAGGEAARLTADTVIDVYFIYIDPPQGEYKAAFFAAGDFADAVADATMRYWRLDGRGGRLHNGNFFSPLDASLVAWSVVPETADFGAGPQGGYITQFTVVPEPCTPALLLFGAAAMLRRRRCKAIPG